MSARVTRKRARPEGEEDLPPAKREVDTEPGAAEREASDGRVFKKDDEFWFDDGTVILVARDVEFRVYKGLLAGHSPVFKDLFAQPHPMRNVSVAGEQTTLCPVIQLEDSPEDLRHLLRACISNEIRSWYEEPETSFHETSAFMRLGSKYKITKLYTQSLDYIKQYFPTDMMTWMIGSTSWGPPGWEKAVNLARLTGELSLLPTAFMSCIRGGVPFVNGFTREDGSTEVLSPDHLNICIRGNNNLCEANIAAVIRTFNPTVSPDCKTHQACKAALSDGLQSLAGRTASITYGDPFAILVYLLPQGYNLEVCDSCSSMVYQRQRKEHEDMWAKLPQFFGIEISGWAQPEGGET